MVRGERELVLYHVIGCGLRFGGFDGKIGGLMGERLQQKDEEVVELATLLGVNPEEAERADGEEVAMDRLVEPGIGEDELIDIPEEDEVEDGMDWRGRLALWLYYHPEFISGRGARVIASLMRRGWVIEDEVKQIAKKEAERLEVARVARVLGCFADQLCGNLGASLGQLRELMGRSDDDLGRVYPESRSLVYADITRSDSFWSSAKETRKSPMWLEGEAYSRKYKGRIDKGALVGGAYNGTLRERWGDFMGLVRERLSRSGCRVGQEEWERFGGYVEEVAGLAHGSRRVRMGRPVEGLADDLQGKKFGFYEDKGGERLDLGEGKYMRVLWVEENDFHGRVGWVMDVCFEDKVMVERWNRGEKMREEWEVVCGDSRGTDGEWDRVRKKWRRGLTEGKREALMLVEDLDELGVTLLRKFVKQFIIWGFEIRDVRRKDISRWEADLEEVVANGEWLEWGGLSPERRRRELKLSRDRGWQLVVDVDDEGVVGAKMVGRDGRGVAELKRLVSGRK